MCDAVRFGCAESRDSKELLEGLEASNLFIVPLDNERRWYRYHQLFADLLQSRLKRFYPEGETVRLQPSNVEMEPIFVPAARLRIQGLVVGLMRKY